jgi:hypothetical protein
MHTTPSQPAHLTDKCCAADVLKAQLAHPKRPATNDLKRFLQYN